MENKFLQFPKVGVFEILTALKRYQMQNDSLLRFLREDLIIDTTDFALDVAGVPLDNVDQVFASAGLNTRDFNELPEKFLPFVFCRDRFAELWISCIDDEISVEEFMSKCRERMLELSTEKHFERVADHLIALT